jgi:arylformamidase
VRHALTWCRDNAKALNVESGRLSVSGHSSGGHLAAMAALVVWEDGAALDPFIDGVIIASGSYDLEPVRLSARNSYLQLSAAEGRALSPIAHLKQNPPPCTVICSRRELPEFQRQSAEMAEALAARGRVRRIESDVATHFDTWELITPDALAGPADAADMNRDA